jgi:hypothetical protein
MKFFKKSKGASFIPPKPYFDRCGSPLLGGYRVYTPAPRSPLVPLAKGDVGG